MSYFHFMTEGQFEYDEAAVLVSPLARPLADRECERRTLALVQRERELKRVFRGVKEVKKALRRNHKGLVVLAADTHPFDVIGALPVRCETQRVPYLFVRSKRMLSRACGTRETATAVLVEPGDMSDTAFAGLVAEADALARERENVLFTE